MINTIWKSYFQVPCCLCNKKKLLYIEFRVFRKRRKKKSWRCRNDPGWLLPFFGFGSGQRFSLSRQSFLALCRDMILYVATWFSSCRRCWVAIGIFLVMTKLFSVGFFSRHGSSLCRNSFLSSVRRIYVAT